jgi:hypothetical protein
MTQLFFDFKLVSEDMLKSALEGIKAVRTKFIEPFRAASSEAETDEQQKQLIDEAHQIAVEAEEKVEKILEILKNKLVVK